MTRSHYDNLQVSRKASEEVIKGAYKYLSQKWHPDKHPETKKKNAERIMKIISEAYLVLSNPTTRAEHDKWLAQQEHDERTTKADTQKTHESSGTKRPRNAIAPRTS